jgi:hypothetical protein
MEQHLAGDALGFLACLFGLAAAYKLLLWWFARKREALVRHLLDRLNLGSELSKYRALKASENKPHIFQGQGVRCEFCARLDTHEIHWRPSPHPRELDRLYVMDERGNPLMKRGTECD